MHLETHSAFHVTNWGVSKFADPKKIGFFMENSSVNEKTCISEANANTYTIRITDLEGR